jgi:hypothetical protein
VLGVVRGGVLAEQVASLLRMMLLLNRVMAPAPGAEPIVLTPVPLLKTAIRLPNVTPGPDEERGVGGAGGASLMLTPPEPTDLTTESSLGDDGAAEDGVVGGVEGERARAGLGERGGVEVGRR